jgi:hypothetical protein
MSLSQLYFFAHVIVISYIQIFVHFYIFFGTFNQVITEELGMNLENFEPQMFGTCKKVKAVSFDGCTLFLSSYKLNC